MKTSRISFGFINPLVLSLLPRFGSRTTEQNSRKQNSNYLRWRSRPAIPREIQMHLQDPLMVSALLPWFTRIIRYLPSNSAYAPILLPDHSVGHNIVHFGCCQDPNIYSLCPIMKSPILSTGFTTDAFGSSSPQRN